MPSCATLPSSVGPSSSYCIAACVLTVLLTVSYRGVVFFKDQRDLEPEDLGRLALRLGELAGKPEDSTLHMCVW